MPRTSRVSSVRRWGLQRFSAFRRFEVVDAQHIAVRVCDQFEGVALPDFVGDGAVSEGVSSAQSSSGELVVAGLPLQNQTGLSCYDHEHLPRSLLVSQG